MTPLKVTADKMSAAARTKIENAGGSVTINQVRTITPTSFQEEPVLTIPPVADSPYPLGLHTITFADGFVAIDGKTRVWGFYAVTALLSKIRRRRAAQAARRSGQADRALKCGS